jgi:hypothetical protein
MSKIENMNYLGLAGTVAIVLLIFSIAWMALSVYMCYWAYKKKGILGLLLALFLGFIGIKVWFARLER